MPTLPEKPNLEQLRRQAKDLLRAARAGNGEAAQQVRNVSERLTLAAAQLVVARAYGFQSWRELKSEVEARTRTLRDHVDAFLAASVGWRIGRARRLLDEHPEIAGYSLATAVVLGDLARVQEELDRDPELPQRTDPRNGWTALHAACASRWHLDPERADGLLSIVRLLLDAGAKVNLRHRGQQWSPLRCAVASTGAGRGNEGVIRLLLERGATLDDHDLYLAGFAAEPEKCVALLLEYVSEPRELVAQALAPAVGGKKIGLLRLLLDAGADPNRYRDDEGRTVGAVAAAIEAGADLVQLLLEAGADPDVGGHDGRPPYAMAMARGRGDLLLLLRAAGAAAEAGDLDWLIFACLGGDRAQAERFLAGDAGLLAQLTASGTLHQAAEAGKAEAVQLMLDLGVPVSVTRADDGATALHVAAYAGGAASVKVLLGRGASIEARDARWNSTPLDWALVGSGERPDTCPAPDWVETTRRLLDAGASIEEITLSPNGDKQPSREVADLVRSRGAGEIQG